VKVINLDELELKCIEFGITNKLFTKEDLKDKNLFTISMRGLYHNKTIDILFKVDGYAENDINIRFNSENWENLYYKINDFFRDYWNYIKDNNKMPLYMKLCEAIDKHSKNGVVTMANVDKEIKELL
jgi:hypothetical protein